MNTQSVPSPNVKPELAIHLPTYSPAGCTLLRKLSLPVSSKMAMCTNHSSRIRPKFTSYSAPNSPSHGAVSIPEKSAVLPTTLSSSLRKKYAKSQSERNTLILLNSELDRNLTLMSPMDLKKHSILGFAERINQSDKSISKEIPSDIIVYDRYTQEPYVTSSNSEDTQSAESKQNYAFSIYMFASLLTIFSTIWLLGNPQYGIDFREYIQDFITIEHFITGVIVFFSGLPMVFQARMNWVRSKTQKV